MSRVNKSRMDYMVKLKELIDEYNDGAKTVIEVFDRLVQLAEELNEEGKRYIREELENEQQLAMFDLLTQPEPDLSNKEKEAGKSGC